MCGFLVYASKSNNILSAAIKKKILNSQKHRGPDKSSYIKIDNIYFFHNRLKIIDLSDKANQPFISNKTGNIIVFNGEIYNFIELRKKLSNRKFKSHSDTEVLLYLYEKYGDNFVKFINGMFSIVIYDKKKKKLFSVRDRFGVKPLYMYQDKEKVIYSTEIKPILLLNNKIVPDLVEIKKYIATGLLYENKKTFFKNIYSHKQSYYYNYSLVKWRFFNKFQYWKLKKNKKLACKNFNDFYKEFLIKFENSIKLNLVSDVEVGLLYSSGTDSNFIKNFINLKLKRNIKTFTYGWKNKKYDEVNRLRILGYNFAKDKKLIIDSNKLIKNLKEIIYNCEGPVGGFGTAAMYCLMKIVKKDKIKVLLSGEGGDEFLMGYLNLQILFLKNLYKQDKKKFYLELDRFNYNYNYNFRNANEFIIFSSKFLSNNIFTPDAKKMSDYDLVNFSKNYVTRNINIKNKSFSSIIKNYVFKVKLPKLLSFLDKCSGGFGVESRVPMLDHELVEFLYSNKDSFKFNEGSSKYPIIKWFKENNIKHFSSKLNVATEQREYFRSNNNYKKIISILKNGHLSKLRIIKLGAFKKKYKDFLIDKQLGNSFFIWKILNAEYFLQLFGKKVNLINN
jgi:asparagine synthase (glutamine-hydrolysing)